MESNLLSSGIEMLNEIKSQLLELQEYQAKAQNLRREEERLDKDVKRLEKTIADEIVSTLKKRKSEVEATYDNEINNIRARLKKLKDKREKRKNQKISERILEETFFFKEENTRLKKDIKTVFKQNHMPILLNNRLFYGLYYPICFGDVLIILGALLVTLLIIPCGVYYFLLPVQKNTYLILTYIITVIIFMGLYLLIGKNKDKYMGGWSQVNDLRKKRRENNKQIKSIQRHIKKDRDESAYGLEDLDVEIDRLSHEEEEIQSQKKEALSVFDHTTSHVISGEIKNRYELNLNQMKADQKNTLEEWSNTQDKIKALTLKIANEYEPFLGKDLMTIDIIESLSNIIKEGNASNIAEAVVILRQSTSQK